MITQRKLVNGNQYVEEIFSSAATTGIDLIEILWSKFTDAEHKMYGYETPIISSNNSGLSQVSIESSIGWIEGVTTFYPDFQRRAWGYIFDTPKNRVKLLNSLATGWFQIVDKKLREEIIEKAKEADMPIEHVEAIVRIKKSKRERELESQTKNLESNLEELRYKLMMAENKQKELLEEKDVKLKKRLSGVKIPDRDLATSILEETKNANKLVSQSA